jgi:phage recombination protein Bet
MASKYGMDAETFKNVIKSTVMPGNATNEQMAAFLMVANAYDLNPVTKEIYAFPAQGGGVTAVVGVDGWLRLANRHPQYDGCEFENQEDEKGALVSCTCSVYRKDRGHPTRITEYMSECYRGTATWKSHPRRMLRNKALIQGLRYAIGFAGLHDEDDAEVIRGDYTVLSSAATLRQIQAATGPQEAPDDQSGGTHAPQSSKAATAHTEAPERDSRGVAWDSAIHSANRTRNSDGTWRRKKGSTTVEPEPFTLEQSTGPTFADVMNWIETAETTSDLDEITDAAKDVELTAEQRHEFNEAAATQAAIIERMQQ